MLSTPDAFSRGIITALMSVLDDEGLSGAAISGFVHGTTAATNAVLENSGPEVGLLTTDGFVDVLEIGRGHWGGDIHDLTWVKPPPLVPRDRRLALTERINARGQILVPLDPAQVPERLRALDAAGITTIAVCLLNAYANPVHELAIKTIAAAEFPHLTVCISHDVLPEIREFERTSTTAIIAYPMPVVGIYLDHLEQALSEADCRAKVLVMQSTGGLASADRSRHRPVDIVESGPAIIEDLDATILVPPHSTALRDRFGNILITLPEAARESDVAGSVNATTLELVKKARLPTRWLRHWREPHVR